MVLNINGHMWHWCKRWHMWQYVCDQSMMSKTTLHIQTGRRGLCENRSVPQQNQNWERGFVWVEGAVGFCGSWVAAHIYLSEFKFSVQDMILDEIIQKQLIWYGHVEGMDPTSQPKIMIHWEPEGRKKRGHPWRIWKAGIYTAMNERDLNMGEWNNRRQWSMAAGRCRQT
jgi:hypothetical protein